MKGAKNRDRERERERKQMNQTHVTRNGNRIRMGIK